MTAHTSYRTSCSNVMMLINCSNTSRQTQNTLTALLQLHNTCIFLNLQITVHHINILISKQPVFGLIQSLLVTANTLIVYLSVCCLTTLSDFTETCNGCLLLVGPRCTECRIFPLSLLVAMSLTQTDTGPLHQLCVAHI